MSIEELKRGRDIVVEELETTFPILNICDVMDWIYWTFEKKPFSQTWEWESTKVKEFCANFRVYLYEECRENFFPHRGVVEAKERGYRGVILSDLS